MEMSIFRILRMVRVVGRDIGLKNQRMSSAIRMYITFLIAAPVFIFTSRIVRPVNGVVDKYFVFSIFQAFDTYIVNC